GLPTGRLPQQRRPGFGSEGGAFQQADRGAAVTDADYQQGHAGITAGMSPSGPSSRSLLRPPGPLPAPFATRPLAPPERRATAVAGGSAGGADSSGDSPGPSAASAATGGAPASFSAALRCSWKARICSSIDRSTFRTST